MDKYGTGQDPYCYPGTQILRNTLNLTDPDELAAAERELTAVRQGSIEFEPPPYNFAFLKRLHRCLFQDIYEWAGETRTIDLSKGTTRFCTADRIEPEAVKLFQSLQGHQWFETFERSQLVTALAEFYGDLNVIHPFREGNGRASRQLCEFIVINAGYGIGWGEINPDQWLHASIDAVICDYQALELMFDRAIDSELAD